MTRTQDLFAAFICGAVFVALLLGLNHKRIVVEEVPATKRGKDSGMDTESETSPFRILKTAT